MSDVLDLRNWDISAFDPALGENEKDESIQKEIEKGNRLAVLKLACWVLKFAAMPNIIFAFN